MSMRFSTSTGSVSPLDQYKRSNSVCSDEDFGRREYRCESLGSQEGRGRLIEQTCKNAIQNSINPVKLSFNNVSYTKDIPTTSEERAAGMGKTKPF